MQLYNKILVGSSISGTSSYEKLAERITTRVMALKILKQKEYDDNTYDNLKSYEALVNRKSSLSERSRQSSRFLLGTAIPNSIVRSESLAIKTIKETEDKNTLRAKRDASVREIIKRVEARLMSSNADLIENEEDKIDSTNNTNTSEKLNEAETENDNSSLLQSFAQKASPWDIYKERQRIARRTSILAPLSGERRSTYELIRNAIQNSNVIPEIIDIDSIERKRLRKMNNEKSPSQNSSFILTKDSSSQKFDFLNKITSKTSRTSKRSITSLENSKKLKQSKHRKSILKRGSRDSSKPILTVSIIESQKEDSETQTYLRMKDFTSRS